MLHSVHNLNPTLMNRVASTLQRLQDDPEVLDRTRRRFDADEPPPPCSPATITDPPSPTFFAQRSEHEINELVRQPLDNEELYWVRKSFGAYHAGARFRKEARQEEQRIRDEWGKRDEYWRPLYRGPDLIGRPGMERLEIMVRNGVRKRWERLCVWNPEWGMPGRVNKGANDNTAEWRWKWEKPRQVHVSRGLKEYEEEKEKWPTQDKEGPNARAIRRLLQSKGQWGERYGPALAEDSHATEVDIDPDESRITSRPWFWWDLEVGEEVKRLRRAPHLDMPVYEKAKKNAKARWQTQGDWKDTWRDTPGWKWRHESPSPEPEDPNDMDFSPSEIDALEAIPPPTPTPPLHFKPCPVKDIRDLFSAPLGPGPVTAAQRSDDAESNVGNEVDGIGDDLNGDALTEPSDGEPFPAHEQPETASAVTHRRSQKQRQNQVNRPSSGLSTTRKLRKRKRNGEDEACNGEPSLAQLNSLAAPRQAKRPRTTPDIHRAPPQSIQTFGFDAKSTRQPTSVEHIRRNPDELVADSARALQATEARVGPRRSSRIRERRGTGKSTPYDVRQVEPNLMSDGHDHRKPSRRKKWVEPKVLTNGSVLQSITEAQTGQRSLRTSPRRKGGVGAKGRPSR